VPQNVGNIFDETGEWARSSFDHTHQFIASGVYQLPFFENGSGLAHALLGGWRANAIFIVQSGAPFTVNLSVDRANIGAGPAQRPDQLRDPNLDFALAKTWSPGGTGGQLEFRWEIFDLFNRANFDLPNRTFGNANFGRIFSARSPREMQFGLRYAF